jgi:hypothetical protein
VHTPTIEQTRGTSTEEVFELPSLFNLLLLYFAFDCLRLPPTASACKRFKPKKQRSNPKHKEQKLAHSKADSKASFHG